MNENLPENQPSTSPPAPQVIPPKKSNTFLVFTLGILFTLLLGGGLFILFKDKFVSPFPILPSSLPSETMTSPVSDVAAGWKTYTNTQYGYEFKYPGRWREEKITENYNPRYYGNGSMFFACDTSVFSASVMDISQPDSAYSDLNSYLKIAGFPLSGGSLTTGKDIKLGNLSAKYYESPGFPGSDNPKAQVIFFSKAKGIIVDLYFMNSCGESLDQVKSEFDQILSTFKFTE